MSLQRSILITGASGFIGSSLVDRALREGFDVWAGIRRGSSRRYLQDPRIHIIELPYDDEPLLCRRLSPLHFDAVLHAAGATKCRHKEDFERINTGNTLRLARALCATGALKGRFIFLSTLGIYGPIHEKDMAPLPSDDIPCPNTYYGRSKLLAERSLAAIPELDYIFLRPTGVYGPREKDYYEMALSIKHHADFAVGYKPQLITFIYIDDLVDAVFKALDNGPSRAAYNLTEGRAYHSRAFSDLLQENMGIKGVCHIVVPIWALRAVSMLCEKAAALFGKTSTLNTDKANIMAQRNWTADISAAENSLSWTPRWSLDKGVARTVRWYKDNGWL